MSVLAFLDIGFSEMLVVAFVALLLFGGRLPEVMRTLGMSYRKFRKGMDDMTRQVTRPDLGVNLKDLTDPYRPIPPASTKPPPGIPPPAGSAASSPPSPPTSAAPAATEGLALPTAAAVAPAVASAPVVPAFVPPPQAAPPPEAPRARDEDDTPHV